MTSVSSITGAQLVRYGLLAMALCMTAQAPADAPGEPSAFGSPGPEARAHAFMALDPPDWDGARGAFLEAAEEGSPTAMSYLGWIHEEGHGVTVDGRAAVRWYARAAQAGAHELAVKLGWMHLAGDLVEPSRERAEAWFDFAIEAGHGPGKIALASVLIADAQGGREVERVLEARELLERALEGGHPTAAFFIARLYIEGIGGYPVNAGEAARYTEIGAEHGNVQMQGWLAFMYYQGRGVAQNPVTAAKWANLAAVGGDSMGQRLRLRLEQELATGEIQEARQRALAWALERR